MHPEGLERDVGRRLAYQEIAGGARNQDLTSMADVTDARRAVEIEPDKSIRRLDRLAGVKTHAHQGRCPARPLMGHQSPLSGDGSENGSLGASEYGESTVALIKDLLTAALGDSTAKDPPMIAQDLGVHSIAQALQ
jgi:hypothetical protein